MHLRCLNIIRLLGTALGRVKLILKFSSIDEELKDEFMRKYLHKSPGSAYAANFAWKAEVQEFVRLPRRSRDSAASFVFEPVHVQEKPLGNLYLVGHLEDAETEQQSLLQTLFLEARKTYYQNCHGAPEESFKDTLKQLNDYLQHFTEQYSLSLDLERFHVALIAIAETTIMISEAGSVFSYLVRSDNVIPISKKNPPGISTVSAKPFTHLIRGDLQDDDSVLVTTAHFVNKEFLRYLGDKARAEITEQLMHHGETGHEAGIMENRAAAALLIRCAKQRTGIESAMPPLLANSPLREDVSRGTEPSMTAGILVCMFPQKSERVEYAYPTRENGRARQLATYAEWTYRRLHRWYILLPLASGLLLSATVPGIIKHHRDAESYAHLNEALNEGIIRLQTLSHNTSQIKKRSLLAELKNTFGTDNTRLIDEADRIESLFEGAIRRIDQESTPKDLRILADFNQFSVVFSPELVLKNGSSHIISEKDVVQLVRIGMGDSKPRLVITGHANKDVLALTKTFESPQRLAYVTGQELIFLEPQDKTLQIQKTAMPKAFGDISLLVSGAKELFAISFEGPIARKLISAKASDPFRPLALPKAFQGIHWQAAAVLPPSLYLLTEDSRLIEVTGQKISGDTVINIDEAPTNGLSMRPLDRVGLLALLDSADKRIILLNTKGNIVRQYHHELFEGMRDIVTTNDKKTLVLTTMHLLEFSYEP